MSTFTKTLSKTGKTDNELASVQERSYTDYYISTSYPGVIQGKTGNDGRYVGIMNFSGLSAINWKASNIKTITFSFNSCAVSSNTAVTGQFTLYSCQKTNFGYGDYTGLDYLGNEIFYYYGSSGASTLVLSKTDNSDAFNSLVQHLKGTPTDWLCLFDSRDIGLYRIANITLTIEYDNGLVYYGIAGEWKPHLVYYGVDGEWKQVSPNYGIENQWKQIGGS